MGDRLKGKRAFIPAAGQGMGRAAAIAFAADGANVWATDVNAEALRSLEGTPGVTTRVLDVTDGNASRCFAAPRSSLPASAMSSAIMRRPASSGLLVLSPW